MKAFCTSCGAPMEPDDRHCRRCGRLQTGPMVVRAVREPQEAPRQPLPPPPRTEPWPQQRAPGRFDVRKLLLLAGLLVLVIFAAGLTIGRLTSSGPTRTAGGQASNQQQAPAVVTPTPSPTPTPTPSSAAHFVNVSWSIPGSRCSTANGCPASGVFRNQGPERGEGTARFDVTSQDGATVYASCTAPIPAADPGATSEASCSANSPDLAALWKQNPGALITLKVTAT
jgi:hypothetical protein